MEIRPLRAEDLAGWRPLWDGYLRFYRADLSEEITHQAFTRLTERSHGMFGLVAAGPDRGLAGFAHCVLHPTTWTLGGACYLEDLFVDPAARGTNVARSLIDAAAAEARDAGAGSLYWRTQAFNGAARSLYDTVGHLTSFVHYERALS